MEGEQGAWGIPAVCGARGKREYREECEVTGGVLSSTSWTFAHEIEALHPDEVWNSIGACKLSSQNPHLK